MKSIFAHFSMPVISFYIPFAWPTSVTLYGKVIYLNGLSWYCSYPVYAAYACKMLPKLLIKPLIAIPKFIISSFAFAPLFLILILAVFYISNRNRVSLTWSQIIIREITAHFIGIHPELKAIKIKWVGNKQTAEVCTYQIGYALSYLFISLALINLGGMIAGTWCITTWFSATIGLALMIWILTALLRGYNYVVLFCKNTQLYEGEELIFLAGFFPAGTPLWLAPLMVAIEVLSWIIRFLSMGLRIAGNIVAGHVILGIIGLAYITLNQTLGMQLSWYCMLPMNTVAQMAYSALFILELAVACIQAYVLTLLTSTFLKETTEIH